MKNFVQRKILSFSETLQDKFFFGRKCSGGQYWKHNFWPSIPCELCKETAGTRYSTRNILQTLRFKHSLVQFMPQSELFFAHAFSMWYEFSNPFPANVPILYPPENTRKPLVFWCFQGVWNGKICRKWVTWSFKRNIERDQWHGMSYCTCNLHLA